MPAPTSTAALTGRGRERADPGCLGVIGDPRQLVDDGVLERTDALDLAAHDVAIGEVARWPLVVADARRRPGGDHVARLEGDRPRRERHERGNVEDHLGRARVLPGLAVHRRSETKRLRIAELVGGDDRRAHRREAVGTLRPQPLAVLALEVAHRDVVEDRVPEDGVHGLRAIDPRRPPPDDHRQLALEIELLGRGRPGDRCAGMGDGIRELAEQDRVGRRLDPLLAAMVVVVQADADDLAGAANRRLERDLVRLESARPRAQVFDVPCRDPARQHLADVGDPEDRGQIVDRSSRRLDAEPRSGPCAGVRDEPHAAEYREVRAR